MTTDTYASLQAIIPGDWVGARWWNLEQLSMESIVLNMHYVIGFHNFNETWLAKINLDCPPLTTRPPSKKD